jgi:hypothetical protein
VEIRAIREIDVRNVGLEAKAGMDKLNWSPKNGRHEVCYFDHVEDV